MLSNILGEFDETFRWEILSSSKPLLLQFKGTVVGPSFTVDSSNLDFGIVSYGFRYTKEITLLNTSEIPMKFVWRVDEDNEGIPEFQVIPSGGRVLPKGKQVTRVELVSKSIAKYQRNLVLDIPDVGSGLVTVPILAECAVPKLEIETDILDFDECFIRHNYERDFKIINRSNLPSKFEILQQDVQSRSLATFRAHPDSGGIPAQGEQTLNFVLATSRLGRIQLPVRVRVVGSRNPPLEFAIKAKSVGPTIRVDVNSEDLPEGSRVFKTQGASMTVDFGKVQVLQDHDMFLVLGNSSPIPAEFKTFIEGKDSVFQVRFINITLNFANDVLFRSIFDQ